jgi:hypothetical protein
MIGGALLLSHCGGPASQEHTLARLVPAAGQVAGWAPRGEPQVFEGEALFELINGGAEIYHEFGFRRALAADYVGPGDGSIALEIFEMADPAAAWGVYSFKTGDGGRPLEVGDAAELEDYYLNVLKGRYVVTLTAMTLEDGAREGLLPLALSVARRIDGSGRAPEIVSLLETEGGPPVRAHYLRGQLALANVTPVLLGVELGMEEGAAARLPDHIELVFRYADAAAAQRHLAAVAAELGDRPDVTLLDASQGRSLTAGDDTGLRIGLAQVDSFIVGVVSAGDTAAGEVLDRLATRAGRFSAPDNR